MPKPVPPFKTIQRIATQFHLCKRCIDERLSVRNWRLKEKQHPAAKCVVLVRRYQEAGDGIGWIVFAAGNQSLQL
jgi:hypothetical protein